MSSTRVHQSPAHRRNKRARRAVRCTSGVGGNMDSPEASVGNTAYFPVNVKGGLLYLGDGHAAMGDGEIAGTAIEVRAPEGAGAGQRDQGTHDQLAPNLRMMP